MSVVLRMLFIIAGFIAALFVARTERVLEALRDLTSPHALVVREGHRQRIAGRDVVRGDPSF
jgi:Ca2+-transporting ATPase